MSELDFGEGCVPMSNLSLLYEFNQSLAQAQDISAILHNIMAYLQKIIEVERGLLGIVDRSRHELVVEAVCGSGLQDIKGNRCNVHEGKTGQILRHGSPTIIRDVTAEPLLRGIGRENQYSDMPFACAPLQWRNASLGILGVNYPYPTMEEETIKLLGLVASCASPVLVVIRWGDEISLDNILRSKLERAVDRMDVHTESHGSLMADVVALVEQSLIRAALEKVNYVQVAAARFLGINRNTLRKKIKELDIPLP